jgi:sodium-coupled neutral amino acid transporter 11
MKMLHGTTSDLIHFFFPHHNSADKSLRVIVGLASFHPSLRGEDVRSYEDLASYPFGRVGFNFIMINMFVCAYGAMLAYLLIIKDTIPTIMGVEDEGWRVLIMCVTSVLIMLPLSMQRDMASLSATSLFSVLADLILVIFICSFAPVKETVEQAGGLGTVLLEDSVNPTLFIGLGILSTAMACQHSAFIVSGSLEDKTMTRWAKVTGFSIGTSGILCAILGVSGYLGFLENTDADVLRNFDGDSFVANSARFLLAITMFFTYPMECFVARHVVIQLFHGGDMDGRDDPNHDGQENTEAGGFAFLNRRQTWTGAIYMLTLVPALFIDDLGPVLSITGSLGAGSIAYLAPGLVYLGVNGDAFLFYAHGLLCKGKETDITAADLPVEGDAKQVIATFTSTSIENAFKPIWWYVTGFPLWCRIATIGRENMILKLGRDSESGSPYNALTSPQCSGEDSAEDIISPNGREFCSSIFFIVFGFISIIAGLSSNIYVILKGDDDEYY